MQKREQGTDDRKHLSTPPERANDSFARESFTFRRMQPWQITAMSAVLGALVVLAVVGWMVA